MLKRSLLLILLAGCNGSNHDSQNTPPQTAWTSANAHVIEPPTEPRTDRFEAAGYFDPTVTYHNGTYFLFASTLRVHADAAQGQQVIMRAVSNDGIDWTFDSDPVLEPTEDNWDTFGIETPDIAIVPSANCSSGVEYQLYYSSAERLVGGLDIPSYQIGLATSCNSVNFTRIPAQSSPYGRAGLVLTVTDLYNSTGGIVADPDVIVMADGSLLLSASTLSWIDSNADGIFQESEQTAFGIVTAQSNDGRIWTRFSEAPIEGLGLDAQQPSVIRHNGQLHMWYTTDKGLIADSDRVLVPISVGANATLGFSHATSIDGIVWIPTQGYDLQWNPNRAPDYFGWFTGVEAVIASQKIQLLTTGVFPADSALLEHQVSNTMLRPNACPSGDTCSVRANSGLSLWTRSTDLE